MRQFRYYLVDQDVPAVAFRFRKAFIASIEQLKSYPHIGTLVQTSIPCLRSWLVQLAVADALKIATENSISFTLGREEEFNNGSA